MKDDFDVDTILRCCVVRGNVKSQGLNVCRMLAARCVKQEAIPQNPAEEDEGTVMMSP